MPKTKSLPITPAELNAIPLFTGLSPAQLRMLSALMQRHRLPANTPLIQVEESCQAVYFLQKGTVKVCIQYPHAGHHAAEQSVLEQPVDSTAGFSAPADSARRIKSGKSAGEDAGVRELAAEPSSGVRDSLSAPPPTPPVPTQVTLNVCGPGEVLGELCLLDGGGHTASVITLEPCIFLSLERELFLDCVDTQPALTRNLLAITTQRLRRATSQLLAFSTQDTAGRVATQLLSFAQRYGEPTLAGDTFIRLRLDQSLLADLVGASRAGVNIVLSSFRAQGLVSTHKTHFFILHDLAALQALTRS